MAGTGARVRRPRSLAAIGALAVAGAADAKKKAPAKLRTATAVATVTGSPNLATATATCPNKTRVISGGFTTTAPAISTHWLNVYESQRVGDTKWRVSWRRILAGRKRQPHGLCLLPAPEDEDQNRAEQRPVDCHGRCEHDRVRDLPAQDHDPLGRFRDAPVGSRVERQLRLALDRRHRFGLGGRRDQPRGLRPEDGDRPRLLRAAEQAERTLRERRRHRASELDQGGDDPRLPEEDPRARRRLRHQHPVGGLDATALVYESRVLAKSWFTAASASGASDLEHPGQLGLLRAS